MNPEAHIRQNPQRVLIDTAEWSDAICSGRERVEDLAQDEPGLRMTYEGGEFPTVTLNGEDGEIRLVGATEIFLVAQEMKRAAFLACREYELRHTVERNRQRNLRRARSHLRLSGCLP